MNHDSRRPTLGLPAAKSLPMPPVAAPRKPMVAKGHDAILKNLQDNHAKIIIVTMSDDTYRGEVVNRDRWTITVRDNDGQLHTIYKHAIQAFSPVVS